MENIIGYDEYEKDFQELAAPEHQYLAEQMLQESLETDVSEESLEVHVDDVLTKEKTSLTFLFDMQQDEDSQSGKVLLAYRGYY